LDSGNVFRKREVEVATLGRRERDASLLGVGVESVMDPVRRGRNNKKNEQGSDEQSYIPVRV
jgi:hypothetical protein